MSPERVKTGESAFAGTGSPARDKALVVRDACQRVRRNPHVIPIRLHLRVVPDVRPAGPRRRGAGGRRLRWIGRAVEGPGDATVGRCGLPTVRALVAGKRPCGSGCCHLDCAMPTESQGPGGAIRCAQVRALPCPCAHARCTRLLVITRMRAAEDRWTMTGYARPSEGRFLMNTVAKDTGTASGAMAYAISAGTGSRYG